MDLNLIVNIVLLAYIIIRSIVWQEQKEKLYVRLEKIEKDIETLKGAKGDGD